MEGVGERSERVEEIKKVGVGGTKIKVESIKRGIVKIVKRAIEGENIRITIKTETKVINNTKVKTITIRKSTKIKVTTTIIEVKSIKSKIE